MLGFYFLFIDDIYQYVIAAKNFYEHFEFLQTEDYLVDTIGGKELREVRFIYRNK